MVPPLLPDDGGVGSDGAPLDCSARRLALHCWNSRPHAWHRRRDFLPVACAATTYARASLNSRKWEALREERVGRARGWVGDEGGHRARSAGAAPRAPRGAACTPQQRAPPGHAAVRGGSSPAREAGVSSPLLGDQPRAARRVGSGAPLAAQGTGAQRVGRGGRGGERQRQPSARGRPWGCSRRAKVAHRPPLRPTHAEHETAGTAPAPAPLLTCSMHRNVRGATCSMRAGRARFAVVGVQATRSPPGGPPRRRGAATARDRRTDR